MGDTVLERNLCFVDTPGYSGGTSVSNTFSPYRAQLTCSRAWNALLPLWIISDLNTNVPCQQTFLTEN